MAHKARKRFGQHFLHDEGVIEGIVRAIEPGPDDNMVEIGPGMSALTGPLLDRLDHLTVIEIDRDLAARLSQLYSPDHLTVVQGDVLDVDFRTLGERLRIVGNLPYNISSPILFHLIAYADRVVDQHFMLQLEVVERMVAQPSTPHYGRLSVMLQSRYRMVKLFDVDPDAFDPPPAVMSSVVRMTPLPDSRVKPASDHAFAQVVARSFGQRRKMLRRVLSDWSHAINWEAAGVAPTARAEELGVDQFITLADQLHHAGVITPASDA